MPNLKPLEDAFPELPPHFARINDKGLVELVEIATGRILLVQGHHRSVLEMKWDRLVRIDTPQGPVFLEKGLNLDYTNYVKHPVYSKMLADLLCQRVVEGKSLISAAKEFNLEYATIKFWLRNEEEFRENLKLAEKDRADYYFEETLEKSRKADKKVEIETLKWATEKANPEKYGTKTKISGDANAPLTFLIGTGITRNGDQNYIAPENQEQGAPKSLESGGDTSTDILEVVPSFDGVGE